MGTDASPSAAAVAGVLIPNPGRADAGPGCYGPEPGLPDGRGNPGARVPRSGFAGAGDRDQSVAHRTSVLNLAMLRRAVVSVAVYWIRQHPKKRCANLSGFYDFMSAHQSKRAFSLVTARHSSSLAPINPP